MATSKKLTNPDNLGPWLDLQLVGRAETVCEKLQAYVDLGFDHFILQNATYGIATRLPSARCGSALRATWSPTSPPSPRAVRQASAGGR